MVDLSEALVWKQLRSQGLKMFWMPVFLSVVFVGITVLSLQSPQSLTSTTQGSLQQIVELYFGDIDNRYAFGVALFVIQGPYLLATFSGILGINAGQRMSSELIESGQFELLLSSPFSPRQVFVSLLVGTTLLTLLHTVVFGVIAIGIPLVYLLTLGAQLGAQINGVLFVAFILPIPTAVWANLVVILGAMGIGGDLFEGAEDAFAIFGLIPGAALLLLINFYPRTNLVLLATASIVAILCLIAVCSYWVTTRFRAEDILPST